MSDGVRHVRQSVVRPARDEGASIQSFSFLDQLQAPLLAIAFKLVPEVRQQTRCMFLHLFCSQLNMSREVATLEAPTTPTQSRGPTGVLCSRSCRVTLPTVSRFSIEVATERGLPMYLLYHCFRMRQ